MKKSYQIVTRAAKGASEVIEQFCRANGQVLLPLVEMIESASQVVEEVIHEIGVRALEAILRASAEQAAGPRRPGRARGEIRHYGSQPGCVQLADRKLRVQRPRLRHKSQGEVPVPAYEALRSNPATGQVMLGALLRGLSTRDYRQVLPQMAEAAGVSRSAVSRQAIEASIEQLEQFGRRRWDDVEIVVIWIDGQRFGPHHVISAVGADIEGRKHVLGIACGATENAAAVRRLLTGLRERGLSTEKRYLFIIDGSKALRAAIEEVFGSGQAVQRCRNHKIENVMEALPKHAREQVRRLMRAAFRLPSAEEGERRLEQVDRHLEQEYPSAARSLREGLKETFTLQRLKVPARLHKGLASTNVIESPHSGTRKRTRNVCRWRYADMVERWVASAWLFTEKHFRRLDGYQDMWALAAILGREIPAAKGGKIA